MNNFIWQNRTKVYFGNKVVSEHLASLIREYMLPGKRTVLVGYGGGSVKKNGSYDDVMAAVAESGFDVVEFGGIMSNPTVEKMLEGTEVVKSNDVGLILAVGGGSTMDCCKAMAVQAEYDGDAWQDFWMDGKPMEFDPIPCGVIVTMPATGSELNPCAVLTNTETNIKCDRGYAKINPLFALMDPAYTMTMPLRQIKAGTFDILSHVMEGYFSDPAGYWATDDMMEGLMHGIIRDFRKAVENPDDAEVRASIMWAGSLAENGFPKTGKKLDFQAHNMEHQLSAYTNCNHGEGLAVLHPTYYRHIYKDGLPKFVSFAKEVWRLDPADYGSDEELALAGIDALESFIKEVGLPTTLREIGITEDVNLKEIADSCFISDGAFRKMTHEEILEIYNECF